MVRPVLERATHWVSIQLDKVYNVNLVGILQNSAKYIFDKLDKDSQLTVSFIEVYNEELVDLLLEKKSLNMQSRSLSIREDVDGTVFLTGVNEIVVSTFDEFMAALALGLENRSTFSTDVHLSSSRSHAIFTLTMRQNKWIDFNQELLDEQGNQHGDFQVISSKLSFLDLAGSERLKRTGSTGDRQKEGISINTGLMALGNVIAALSEDKPHVPFRESKLTRILQNSLGGNCVTLMIACISPDYDDLGETLNTLKYANRARIIKNNASINIEYSSESSALKDQIANLKMEISQLKNGDCIYFFNIAHQRYEEMTNEMDVISVKNALLVEEKAELLQKNEFLSNELALVQSEASLSPTTGKTEDVSRSLLPIPSRFVRSSDAKNSSNRLSQLETDLSTFSLENISLKRSLELSESEKTEMSLKIQEISNALESAKNETSIISANILVAVKEKVAEIELKKSEIDQLNSNNRDLVSRISQSENKIILLEKKLSESEFENRKSKNIQSSNPPQTTETVIGMWKKLSSADRVQLEQKQMISRLEQQLADSESTLIETRKLVEKGEVHRELAGTLQRQVDYYKRQLAESHKANEALEVHGGKYSSLQKQLKAQEILIAKAKKINEEHFDFASKMDELQNELVIARKSYSQISDENESLNERINSLVSQLKDNESKLKLAAELNVGESANLSIKSSAETSTDDLLVYFI